MDMIDECKAAVANLLPTLDGVDMSFLPACNDNTTPSSDLLDSSSSDADNTSDSSSSDDIDTSNDEEDHVDEEAADNVQIAKRIRRVYQCRGGCEMESVVDAMAVSEPYRTVYNSIFSRRVRG
jgi:hypothetical protein